MPQSVKRTVIIVHAPCTLVRKPQNCRPTHTQATMAAVFSQSEPTEGKQNYLVRRPFGIKLGARPYDEIQNIIKML